MLAAKKLPKDVNFRGVFACNELNLDEVEVYGFDYDYTLAEYKPSLDNLIYNLSLDRLISHYKVSDNAFVYLRVTWISIELITFTFKSIAVPREHTRHAVQQ